MKRGITASSIFPVFCGIALWAACLAATLTLAWVAPKGLEGTDEASWVLCAANPWASPGWGIHFGFALHPLWQLSGNLAGFRLAGIAALWLAGLVFSLALIRAGPVLGAGDRFRQFSWILLPSLACAGLHRYSIGTRTPSYDWLLLVAALLFAAGWLGFAVVRQRRDFLISAMLVSLGLVLAMVAKWVVFPGYLLVLLAVVFFGVAPGRRAMILGSLGVGSLVAGALFVWYATPQGVLDTIRAGFAQVGSRSHESLISHYLVGFLKGAWQVLRAYPWVAGLFAVIWLVLFMGRGKKRPDATWVAGLTFLAGLVLAVARGHWQGGLETFSKGMMIMMVWLTGVYALARPWAAKVRLDRWENNFFHAMVGLCLLLPLVNGLGTATGITDYLVHGSIFYAAAGWIFLGRALAGGLPPWCMASAVLMLGLLQASRALTSTFHTYRMGSVWEGLIPVTVGPEKGKLWIFPNHVRQLEELSHDLRELGYREGDPVVGLTDLCSLVYLLGAVSPGTVWYMGYWLPENQGVLKNLENIPPEILRRTWFLVRAGTKPHEKLEKVWPRSFGRPPPQAAKSYLWSWGDGGGSPEILELYLPAETRAASPPSR